jgi:hypothetical protein
MMAGERLNLIVWNHSTLYRHTDHYKWRDVPEETELPSAGSLTLVHFLAHLKPFLSVSRFVSSL